MGEWLVQKHTLKVLLTIVETNACKAEKNAVEFLINSTREFGNDFRIADFELLEESDGKCCNNILEDTECPSLIKKLVQNILKTGKKQIDVS
jgi:hypothetical protein